ncbi:sensor histidine kinase [Chitinophaga lutea]
MRLQTKLTLFITLSKLAVVLLFVLSLPFLVDRIAGQYNDYYLRQQKKKAMENIRKNGVDFYLQGEPNFGSYTMLKEEYISLEAAGRIRMPDTIATVQRIVESDTLTYRVLTHIFKEGPQTYMLEVGKTTATIGQYNRPLQKMALYVLCGLLIVTVLLDLIYTRLLLRPLHQIIRDRLVGRKFPFKAQPPPIRTSTADFRYLDASLLDLMGKITEAFEKEREFTANASHELMTPVGILQHKIENLMLDGDFDEAIQQRLLGMMKTLGRLKKIIHSLLLISQVENEQFPKTDAVVIPLLVAGVMEELEHRLEEKDLRFHADITRNVPVPGLNQELLFQLLYNLINNAIRYNKQEGTITVSDEWKPGSPYRLIISDTGTGIPAPELPGIFGRFKKAHRSGEEGYGLGLSIVSTIARFLAIDIAVESAEGSGTTIVLTFSE